LAQLSRTSKRLGRGFGWLLLALALLDSRAIAAAVTHIQVHIVTGADELTAGSLLNCGSTRRARRRASAADAR